MLVRHILPNIAGPLIVQTSLSLAFAILSEAALSFLGLGIQPPQPSWGRMIFDSQGFVTLAWWMACSPGRPSSSAVLAFNLFGDGLRDVLDPKQRTMARSARRTASEPRPSSSAWLTCACVSARRDIVRGVSFDVEREKTLGIVGESGFG